MSKYIIELDENAKKVVAISLEDGIMWTDETEVENLEELNSDYINEHYGSLQDEAYQRGINDGSLDAKQRVEGAYQRGLEDGKGAIHKGCEGCRYSGTPQGDSPCFSCSNYYPNNWQKQDDNIEVDCSGDSFIVTRIFHAITGKVECDGVDMDGCTYHDVLISGLTKTGRHVDIDKILGELRE